MNYFFLFTTRLWEAKKIYQRRQLDGGGGIGRVHHFWESSPPQVLKVVYIDKNEFPVKK